MTNPPQNGDDPRVIAGMAAQGLARTALLTAGERSVGWKAGLGAAAAMDKAGISAPVAGFLTGATLVDDGGRVPLDGWTAPTFEPELAVRIDHDVAADTTVEAARAAIGAVAPAIELVDLGSPDDLEALLAGNVFHRAYAVGPWAPVPLERARLRIAVDDDVRAADVDPAGLLGDLAQVVRAIAAQAPLSGRSLLLAGELIITGSAIPAIALDRAATLTVALAGTTSTVSLHV